MSELLDRTMAKAVGIITGGQASEPRPAQHDLSHEVERALDTEGGQALGQAATGTGKALALDTPVLTPDGWTTMGALKVGDTLFDERGRKCHVVAVHRTRTGRACFRLTFSDGTHIVADGEHQWPVAPDADDIISREALCERAAQRYADRGVTSVNLLDLYEDTAGATPLEVLAAAAGVSLRRVVPIDLLAKAADTTLARAGSVEALSRQAGLSVAEAISLSGMVRLAGGEMDEAVSADDFAATYGTNVPRVVTVDPVAVLKRACQIIRETGIPDDVDRIVVKTRELLRRTTPATLLPTLPLDLDDVDLPIPPRVLGRNLARQPDAGAIPKRYMRAGTAQRRELADAILSVIGAQEDGHTFASHQSARFIASFMELLSTLGVHARGSRWGSRARITFDHDARTGVRLVSVQQVVSVPVRCITVDSPSHLFLAGAGAVPTHNSLAYLVPAALSAAEAERRTVVSTESLSLQSQLIDKDAPVVAQAVKETTGREVKFAVLKGWSNYACTVAARESARDVLGLSESLPVTTERMIEMLHDRGTDETNLIAWALEQYRDPAAPGDRHSYEGATTSESWSRVSVTPSECPGANKCPFGDVCKANLARERAADADVVITNHTMLAVQAAKGVPVIIGSKKLGAFDAIIMDEAHGIPSQVRNQGSGEVSGRRVRGLVRRLSSVIDLRHGAAGAGGKTEAQRMADTGDQIADQVDIILARLSKGEVTKIGENDLPTQDFDAMLGAWIADAGALIRKATGGREEMKVKRVLSAFDAAAADLRDVSLHSPGVARWIEAPRDGIGAALRFSTVNVSGPLRRNLWVAPVMEDEPDVDPGEIQELGGPDPSDGPTEKYPLSVVAVSATLPSGFQFDMGMDAPLHDYPSPFDRAFSNSSVFIPRAIEAEDVAALSAGDGWGGRPRFNTGKHHDWAKPIMGKLVEANGGHSLVLAAKAADGREYARYLRESSAGRYLVLDQWSGIPLRQLVAEWRADSTAVLVGTRSLMTGVDAPGDTCSLVIIDRIPRAPSNPVDDARVEAVMEARNIDKWSADRQVYVSDAALLLAQASGRLIRSSNDHGMVAVLDPRLLRKSGTKFSYPEPTRRAYVEALGTMWGKRISRLDKAVEELKS